VVKTLLVGLDAACWEYLDPLLESGELPTLRQLMAGGVRGRLSSTMPPWTPTAWASIITGKNPGKHGIFDMLWRKPGGYEFTPTNTQSRRGTPFWEYLNRIGIRVGLVNIPFTYPPDDIDGFIVCGFGTPGSATDFAAPTDVLQWVRSEYPEYQPAVDPEFLRSAPPAAVLEEETEHQACLVEIALQLARAQSVDVLAINLMLTDHANHKMPTMDLIQEAYRRADSHLDRLIAGFKPENILLISDHGSSRLKGDFLLHAWLRDRGYTVYLKNPRHEQRAPLNWILDQWLRNNLGLTETLARVVRKLLREGVLRLPEAWADHFLDHLSGAIPFAREHVTFSNKVDYANSKVFPGSVYSGLLYLNLAGREEKGAVPVHDKEKTISRLKQELEEIEDPDSHEPLFSNVYVAEEIYSGPALEIAPDLVLDSYDSNWNIRASKHVPFGEKAKNRYFLDAATRSDYGWHSRQGIFIFSGSAFRVGEEAAPRQIYDVPPTLLHLLGAPIPADYDGRVPSDLFVEGASKEEIMFQDGDAEGEWLADGFLSEKESEELADHLRALGYLD